MHLPVFENDLFLQSLGWAIANSFWQAGILWIVYQVSTAKKTSAVFNYNLSIFLLFASFVWFVLTSVQYYYSLKDPTFVPGIFFVDPWVIQWQQPGNALPYLSILYLIVLCYYGLRFIKSFSITGFIQQNGLLKAPVDLRVFTSRTALHLGIKKKIPVWLSEHIDVPSVIGWIKPVILLPAAVINQLTTRQLEAVLLHELAHIKRNDYLVNLLQSFIELVLFFNPFIHFLGNSAKKERENCCDDWVMNYQYNNQDYAHALLILEDQRRRQLALVLTATNGKMKLLNRIKRLFNAEPRSTINIKQKLQVAILGIMVLIGMATIFPSLSKINVGSGLMVDKKTIRALVVQQPLANIYPAVNIEEVSPTLFNDKIAFRTGRKLPSSVKKVLQTRKPDTEFTLALINEDLLNDKPIGPSVTMVSDKEKVETGQCLVKVEEQQSGKKNSNVYYFELKNDNGNRNFKPLLFLNKPLQRKTAQTKKLIDTAARPSKKTTS